jgi:hypothetical protein
VEGAYDGMLLLHNYQSENTPTHKGITAINSKAKLAGAIILTLLIIYLSTALYYLISSCSLKNYFWLMLNRGNASAI